MRWIDVYVSENQRPDGERVNIAVLSGIRRPSRKLHEEAADVTLRLYTDWIDGNAVPMDIPTFWR